jgi:hypothetical protein
MNDRPVIVVGSLIGLALLTFPLWYALSAGAAGPPPDVKVPDGRCVEDRPYMKAHHMDLLDEWRNAVVRDGQKTYVSKTYGTSYEMSLTRTCLECHAATNQPPADRPATPAGEGSPGINQTTFCHQCHDYASVRPTCWQCHVEL